jgi:membrane associated rhomboid family serine protease
VEAGGPDLFVVCKNCGEEVSPYVTECPYCGHRVRKRAPKLEKGMAPSAPKAPRAPRVPRKRPAPTRARTGPGRFAGGSGGERPSWSRARRPYATIFLVLASIVMTVLITAGVGTATFVVGLARDAAWAPATSAFVYFSDGYEIVALGAIFLFGWLLERRHGWWAPLLVFAVCGIGALYFVDAIDPGFVYTGANGAALGMLGAWAARDILQRRAGVDPETDGLGVVVIAVLLVLLPVAAEEAHALAGAVGGVAGLLIGLPLARLNAD